MIDSRICKNPVGFIRWQKADGSFLYSEEECLHMIKVYLDRAYKVWEAEKSGEIEEKKTAEARLRIASMEEEKRSALDAERAESFKRLDAAIRRFAVQTRLCSYKPGGRGRLFWIDSE
jgi:hypothetical protein